MRDTTGRETLALKEAERRISRRHYPNFVQIASLSRHLREESLD